MKRLWRQYRTEIVATGLVCLLYLVFYLLHMPCPIKAFTGISCAGCGMTRALVSLLRLDLAASFSYHPLAIPLVLTLPLLLWQGITGRKRALNNTLLVGGLVLVSVYVLRLFLDDGDVVVWEPQNGLIPRLLRRFFSP